MNITSVADLLVVYSLAVVFFFPPLSPMSGCNFKGFIPQLMQWVGVLFGWVEVVVVVGRGRRLGV